MQNGYADLIESTKLFIEDDPSIIVLEYKTAPTKKPGGGYDNDGQKYYREPQTFKLIPQSDGDGETQAEDGSVKRFNYVLVALPDAIIEIGDSWKSGDTDYRVTGFHQQTDYMVKCAVVAFGDDPAYG